MEEKKEIIRVLNITTVLKAAGIESFIMNMYRNINKKNVQFDFLVMRDEKEYYDEEIKKMGGVKYTISKKSKNILIKVIKESFSLYKFLKNHKYKIVHIHYTTPLRVFYALAAKKAGVKVIIYHSHSAEVSGKSLPKKMLYSLLRRCIQKWATDYFACSVAAANWMFPSKLVNDKKVKIIYNGIDTVKFKYDENNRNEVRTNLGLLNNFVLIHTGRFIEQKNQKFVLDVFQELKLLVPNSKLILLGSGDLFEETKKYAERINVKDDVFFLGVQSNVHKYLSAADCYIMPSLYEGLPVSAVEAECAGLPCYLSTNITTEVALTDLVSFLELTSSAKEWAVKIATCKNVVRQDKSYMVRKAGYDVGTVANKLELFYQNAYER